MRLIELFEAEPIDLAAFRNRRAIDVKREKLANLATDIPNMFDSQKQQEEWFNSELNEIRKRIDIPLKKWQMEIRPLLVQYQPGITIMQILNWSVDKYSKLPSDQEDMLARKFIKAHKWDIQDALKKASNELRELTMDADAMEWPAPWRRYTRYPSFAQELSDFRKLVDSKLFEDGRIVKGVNTTADVDTNEIPRQAAKFGFNTDTGGIPPTLRTDGKF